MIDTDLPIFLPGLDTPCFPLPQREPNAQSGLLGRVVIERVVIRWRVHLLAPLQRSPGTRSGGRATSLIVIVRLLCACPFPAAPCGVDIGHYCNIPFRRCHYQTPCDKEGCSLLCLCRERPLCLNPQRRSASPECIFALSLQSPWLRADHAMLPNYRLDRQFPV